MKAKNEELSQEHRKAKTENEEGQNKFARKFVAGIIQIMTFVFVMRAAQGASSESLLEDVREVVKANGTLAFKLIELCIFLDSPKAIPQQKLEELYEESKQDLVASRLIEIMVLKRLYMFKTTEKDMQWLSGKLKIDIDMQHAITYQQDKRRLIK